MGRVLLDFLGLFFGCPNWYTGSKRSQDAALTLNGITITNMKTKNPTETFSILKKKKIQKTIQIQAQTIFFPGVERFTINHCIYIDYVAVNEATRAECEKFSKLRKKYSYVFKPKIQKYTNTQAYKLSRLINLSVLKIGFLYSPDSDPDPDASTDTEKTCPPISDIRKYQTTNIKIGTPERLGPSNIGP